MKLLAVVLLAVGLTAPRDALAASTSCGTERALSGGQVFRVKAVDVGCRTAKHIAGGWFNVQSQGNDASRVYESNGRRWRCRVTQHATGTDPGFNPYTSVRCTRAGKRVTFKLRS